MIVYLDILSLLSFIHLLSLFLKGKTINKVFYFSSSFDNPKKWASFIEKVFSFKIVEFKYSILDVKGNDNGSILMKTYSQECREISLKILESEVIENPFWLKLTERFKKERLELYARKCISQELFQVLLQIKIVNWHKAQMSDDTNVVFYHKKLLWKNYINIGDVKIIWYRNITLFFSVPKCISGSSRIIKILYRKFNLKSMMRFYPHKKIKQIDRVSSEPSIPKTTIAVAYTGNGLTWDLTKNSDVFWWQFSKCDPDQFLMYFVREDDVLDKSKKAFLDHAQSKSIALNHSATTCGPGSVWNSGTRYYQSIQLLKEMVKTLIITSKRNFKVQMWLFCNMSDFIFQYAYWYCFFKDFRAKIHVNLVDWAIERVPADQALEDLGGISVSFQRSEESFAGPVWASSVHVHFVFSEDRPQHELVSGSFVEQYPISGYIHDHAFEGVKDLARTLRSRLEAGGARFIVCFFDENSYDDPRLGGSNEHSAHNYKFLLEKLLQDENLGLIFKPKKPLTLRKRVEPYLGDLLERGLATGRCILIEEGIVATSTLPCETSSAADVTVGLLLGATAAIESCLAGNRTVLLDCDNLTYHPLRRKLEGSEIIYDNWETLWASLMGFRDGMAFHSAFGDWEPYKMLLDPFCDGRAAERIGKYIGWLSKGFSEGLSRDECLHIAKEKYAALWGENMIVDRYDLQNEYVP